MRWPREPRIIDLLFILLAVIIYLLMFGGVIPLLWPYRDRLLVRVLLTFLSGGHLEELFQETGILL
jgi:hypothetical protein